MRYAKADEVPRAGRAGRPRDPARDVALLDAALDVLAEVGFERMTMDAVAAQAHAGKATVYRRWPSKAHLVVEAVCRLAERQVDLDHLPDTGSLRGDLVGLIRPKVLGEKNRDLMVMAAVASMRFSVDDPELTSAASSASTRPWVTANRILIQRALDRGEISPTIDIELAARLVPSMCMFRDSVEQIPLTAEFITSLFDELLLPALGATRT